jgi:formate C-acetyltransferase
VDFGKRMGATPDGRKTGEEMSKNLSPAPGSDTEGVTALISTLSSLDPADMPMDLPLDVMMHPSAVAGEKGLDVMRVLVEQYHAHGLTLIQFNVLDPATLRDAQAHPRNYENLQVRVCGWNVRWNDLPREQQDAYIRRAETAQ